MSFRREDRNQAAFRDPPDDLRFGLLTEITEKEALRNKIHQKVQDLIKDLREAQRLEDDIVDQIYALEKAVVAYDRARYDMRTDQNWPNLRYRQ